MTDYLVQNREKILVVTQDTKEARRIASADRTGEFYSVRRDIALCAKTLSELGLSCRYTPRNEDILLNCFIINLAVKAQGC